MERPLDRFGGRSLADPKRYPACVRTRAIRDNAEFRYRTETMQLHPLRPALAMAALAALASCTSLNPYYDPAIPHRGPSGFRNNHPVGREGSFLKWQFERWREGVPKPPANGYDFPMAEPEIAFLRSNTTLTTVTWIGHATVLLQTAGRNVLTDPHFTERASPVSFAGPRRKVRPGLAIEELPRIDAVLISHNHFDHLDAASIRMLAAQPGGSPRFFVPLGLKAWFADQGVADVVELDWWQAAEIRGIRIHCVPVQHWSKRTLTDRDQTLWSGWIVEEPSFRFFFAGDTGYSEDFREVRKRYGPMDLAAIPIGAYEPRWFMAPYHVDPNEAVQIHADLESRYSVGVHWGTFELTDEPLDEPPRALDRARATHGVAADRFFVLKHGETWRMPAR